MLLPENSPARLARAQRSRAGSRYFIAASLCALTMNCATSSDSAETADGSGLSGGSAGDAASTDVAAGGRGGKADADIFSDAKMPRCDKRSGTQYQLKGTIGGEALTVSSSTVAYLTKRHYQKLSVVAGEVQVDLSLRWEDSLTFGREVSLTGGSLLVPAGHPKAGRQLCITKGIFGVAPEDGGASVQILFRITGARDGICTGPEMPIDVVGCTFAEDFSLP